MHHRSAAPPCRRRCPTAAMLARAAAALEPPENLAVPLADAMPSPCCRPHRSSPSRLLSLSLSLSLPCVCGSEGGEKGFFPFSSYSWANLFLLHHEQCTFVNLFLLHQSRLIASASFCVSSSPTSRCGRQVTLLRRKLF